MTIKQTIEATRSLARCIRNGHTNPFAPSLVDLTAAIRSHLDSDAATPAERESLERCATFLNL